MPQPPESPLPPEAPQPLGPQPAGLRPAEPPQSAESPPSEPFRAPEWPPSAEPRSPEPPQAPEPPQGAELPLGPAEPAALAPLRGSPNAVEAILRKIPGFHGYLEREHRRKADQLQRHYLADQLQQSKAVLERAALRLTEAGQLDRLPRLERLRGRLDRLIGRIRGAVQGYSGFFDLVRVDVQMLDRVYDYDYRMIEQVEAIGRAVGQLAQAGEPAEKAENELAAAIDEAQRAWDSRREMLEGLK